MPSMSNTSNIRTNIINYMESYYANRDNIESLIYAILENNYKLAGELLTSNPCLIRSIDREGRSVLQWITVNGDPRIVQLFHKFGVPVHLDAGYDSEDDLINDPLVSPYYKTHIRYLNRNNIIDLKNIDEEYKNYIRSYLGFSFVDIGFCFEDILRVLTN